MEIRVPIEQSESERLEFKSKEVLAEPDKVAREVVGMLNALEARGGHGEIWIGVRREPNRTEVQAVENPDMHQRRLQDHLLDVIEPRPINTEVSVSTVPATAQGGQVLLVTVHPPQHSRRPFALLRPQGGRHYLRRFADRLVPMSREEIFAAASKGAGARRERTGAAVIREAFKKLHGSRSAGLWLRLEPEPDLDLDFEQVEEAGLLSDSTRTGTPRSSFNFAVAAHYGRARPIPGRGGLEALLLGDDSLSLRLYKTGALQFVAALSHLSPGRVPFVDEANLLSPEPLLGFTVSLLRLARALLQQSSGDPDRNAGQLWAMLAILGLEGWGLLPGNLANWPAERYQIKRFMWPDFILDPPLAFPFEEVLKDPDRCAVRLVRLLYEAFGFYRQRELPSLVAAGLLPEADDQQAATRQGPR
jgi:Putative DNA-binding domain